MQYPFRRWQYIVSQSRTVFLSSNTHRIVTSLEYESDCIWVQIRSFSLFVCLFFGDFFVLVRCCSSFVTLCVVLSLFIGCGYLRSVSCVRFCQYIGIFHSSPPLDFSNVYVNIEVVVLIVFWLIYYTCNYYNLFLYIHFTSHDLLICCSKNRQ